MALAVFDLDNTLIAGDSDYLWGVFLVERGVVDRAEYERENERFYREYREARLDIYEFLRFSLRPLRENDPLDLVRWREEFLREKIDPIILPAARRLVKAHGDRGDISVIVTATNEFVTGPIAERLGVAHLIATVPARSGGRYTGEVEGTPAFQTGKVERLLAWLRKRRVSLDGSTFYSDSVNDIPLLERVDNPVAVDPDERLREFARSRHWPVISLRVAEEFSLR